MNFQRERSHNRKPRNFIHIYSNGYSEINYFTLKKIHSNKKNIRIEPFFENAGNPHQMVKLIERKYSAKDLDPNDRIYCVTDVDDATDICINDAMTRKAKFITLILSNPNFELWLLLHFKLYTHQFSKNETVEKLKVFLPEYQKPEIEPHFSQLCKNEAQAIQNVSKLKKYHTKEKRNLFLRDANPYSFIGEIIEIINSFE
ncbi:MULTISPECIES: RloB family protein [unclassified Methanoregula]|uniref:RloB family protein n=1 Tax=unclassified Methanoregula TaxID=2649730 RepID=UPI0009CDDA5C|nr:MULTISPECIES: RloB family protein [unclassified Methanoregula]OPX63196.1 MAG: hypothetical protein A4E33_01879 [Methanoregula sp. PtaB.Bin085]OPY33496.1 MAG: hypothetical protein A4E34_01819 [Methanoregula sp. PtaU1.Bin006]